MPSLASQRCFNHAQREAVARCPECGRFFCRECVVEHEDRLLCAVCLGRFAGAPRARRGRLGSAVRVALALLGVLTAWCWFHVVGQALLALPASFHEGTLWRGDWLDQP